MWKYFGVFFNVATVLAGSLLGLFLRSRSRAGGVKSTQKRSALPPREKLPEVMMVALAFCTVFAAASGLIGVENGIQALLSVGSLVIGLLIGWLLRIDDRLNQVGDKLLLKVSKEAEGQKNPAEGVVTATLLFCIGSMTVLGSFESAANPAGVLDLECHTTLMIKSMMDFVSSTCLAVTFGASITASAVCVLVIQGALVALASTIQPFLEQINAMPVINCVGSMILLAIAINLLGLKKIKTGDYLPALFVPILACWIYSLI